MKVVAIIGSPRKNGNTEILAAHTLKAIAEEGIETEMISPDLGHLVPRYFNRKIITPYFGVQCQDSDYFD